MLNPLAPFANPKIRDLVAERVSEEAQDGWLFDHRLSQEDRCIAGGVLEQSPAMVWSRQAGRMLGIITLGAAAVVALGWLLGMLTPDTVPNEQILARTSCVGCSVPILP